VVETDSGGERVKEEGYRGPQACKIVGISYRQLDYWARTDLVKPSLRDARGSGTQRLYSFKDLIHLRVIKNLLDAGVNLPQIRKAIEYLDTELKAPLEDVTLLSDGHSIYAATSEKDIVDLLRRGQGVFGIALGKVFEDLQGSLKEIVPGADLTPAEATGS
jgi:DNA-binding transcriptional MerR regulator